MADFIKDIKSPKYFFEGKKKKKNRESGECKENSFKLKKQNTYVFLSFFNDKQ